MNPSNFILVVDDDPTGAFITEETIGRSFPDCPIHIRNSVETALVFIQQNETNTLGYTNLILLETDIHDAGCFRFLQSFDLIPDAVKNKYKIVIMSSGLLKSEEIQKIKDNPLVAFAFNAPLKEHDLLNISELISSEKDT